MVHWYRIACGAQVPYNSGPLHPEVHWSFAAYGALALYSLWCTGPILIHCVALQPVEHRFLAGWFTGALQPVMHWSFTDCGALEFTARGALVLC